MASAGTDKLLSALGLDAETGRLYDRLRPLAGRPLEQVADDLGTTLDGLRRDLVAFEQHGGDGVVREEDGVLVVLDPVEAVTTMLEVIASGAAMTHERLAELARALPTMAGANARFSESNISSQRPLDGEVVEHDRLSEVLAEITSEAGGDLAYLRPDNWVTPSEDALVDLLRSTVESGRRCRSIYAARAMVDVPLALAARAEAGEEIRLLPEVPSRLMVIGRTHALLPEPFGHNTSPGVVVRQGAVVEAIGLLFEMMWAQAAPVTEFERGKRPTAQRRFLLEQLAAGAQDEQIARRLGVSLRTLRRRVAELMTELDADSRFQAGVEAARRGWV